METDLIPNIRGNVQSLRNMWTTKVQEEQKSLKSKSISYRTKSQIPPLEQSIKVKIQLPINTNEKIINKKPTVTFNDESKTNTQI
jgi:hypothetical protein